MKSWDRVFIGGGWVAPSTEAKLPVISPSREEVIAHVPDAGPADMDRAVHAHIDRALTIAEGRLHAALTTEEPA